MLDEKFSKFIKYCLNCIGAVTKKISMKWPSASPLPYLSPSITSSIRDSACAKLDEERDKALFRIASGLSTHFAYLEEAKFLIEQRYRGVFVKQPKEISIGTSVDAKATFNRDTPVQ